MFDAIKPLLESGMINEETRTAINEAWESKLNEAREQIKAELREEFAGRYQHDKQVMVEAMDRMLTESLQTELQEFHEDRRALNLDRVKFQKHMTESAQKFDAFVTKKLAEEIQELRADREKYANAVNVLERFVVKQLAEEIQEFSQDKRLLAEARVRVVAEAKQKLRKVKENFVKRSSRLVAETVEKGLKSEMNQLKEDIQMARENMFGRRLFEAFANEFAVTHLNENREIRKLRHMIERREQQLAESRQAIQQHRHLVESKERELRIIKESADRRSKMTDLLKPLNKEKADVMSQLLENVQTDKLQSAFEKYLPAVLNEGLKVNRKQNSVLTESRSSVTGDKSAKANVDSIDNNVIEIKRLAGLK
jgi:DNA repair exonuclease SbcCD ATPase subunit